MRLKSIRIHRGWSDKDPLQGEVVFENAATEIKILLDEALSRQVVALCADAIAAAGQTAAAEIRADVLAIEHSPEDSK